MSDAPAPAPLVHATRGGAVESVHAGHLVVLDADGSVLASVGDPDPALYARSALKPLQLAGLLDAGLWPGEAATDDGARRRALALAAASHSGQDVHLDGVRAVLDAAGLDEGHLRNTPDQPLDPAAAAARLAAGTPASSLAQNCSGKHAAMLAACVASGWSTRDYLDADHPVQRAALAGVVARAGAVEDGLVSVDGCGTVLPTVGLTGLARAYGRMASGRGGGADARVAAAMRAHPHLVGGGRRESTAAMTAAAAAGAVAKDGAEGVFALALSDGRSAAWKVADGSTRAHGPLVAAVLCRLGVELDLGTVDRRSGAETSAAGVPAPETSAAAASAGRVPGAGPAPVLGPRPVLGHGRPVGLLDAVPGLLARP